ncbi:MAG: lysogenization protein HflD, partial [Rhodanobacter sp.]
MNEERVLALAGMFQACALAQQLATDGRCDETAMNAGIASVFRIDAPSVAEVYGNVAGVRLGLRSLIAQLDESDRDMAVTRMAVTVMRLERSLSRRPELLNQLQQGILGAQRQVEHFGQESSQVIGRMAELYAATL